MECIAILRTHEEQELFGGLLYMCSSKIEVEREDLQIKRL